MDSPVGLRRSTDGNELGGVFRRKSRRTLGPWSVILSSRLSLSGLPGDTPTGFHSGGWAIPLAKGSSLEVVDTNLKSSQLCDQLAPCQLGRRQRAAIFAGGFLNMTNPAKRLQSVDVVRVLSRFALQRRHVVTFEPSGPTALNTTPAVALEDGAAYSGPAAGVKV